MSTETERAMFGMSVESLEETFGDKDDYERLMAAMSILSDVQEGIERLDLRGRTDKLRGEEARKRINVAKWLIDRPKSNLRKQNT